MDTKSRNYHKLAVAIILLVILLPSLAMMFIRPHYITKQNEKSEIEYADTDFLSLLVKNTYVLYGEENKVEQGKDTKAFSIFFPDYVSTDWIQLPEKAPVLPPLSPLTIQKNTPENMKTRWT